MSGRGKREDAEADQEDRQTYVRNILAEINEQGRTLLTEYEAKQIVAAYGIPTVETILADEAVKLADQIG